MKLYFTTCFHLTVTSHCLVKQNIQQANVGWMGMNLIGLWKWSQHETIVYRREGLKKCLVMSDNKNAILMTGQIIVFQCLSHLEAIFLLIWSCNKLHLDPYCNENMEEVREKSFYWIFSGVYCMFSWHSWPQSLPIYAANNL